MDSLVKLLQATHSTAVLASEESRHVWDDVLARKGSLRLIDIPNIDHLLYEQAVQRYPYQRAFEDGLDHPIWMIQTSGEPTPPTTHIHNNR